MIEIKKVGKFNIHYRPNSSDEDVLMHSFENDIFYEGIPEYLSKKKSVIIDVGAHIGTFSMLSSIISPKGKIYAIEPCKETFEILKKNKIENKIENLLISNIALSDFIGETKLFYDNEFGNWGHSISKEISNDGEIVKTNTLENYFFENDITSCDLIKFNCEGSEFDIILDTPIEILMKIRFALVLFHEDLTSNNLKHTVLVEKLEKANFTVKVRNITNNPTRGWIIAYRGNVIKKLIMQTKFYFNFITKSKTKEYIVKTKIAMKSAFYNTKQKKL
jgi:FkbM family methyltransferase